MEGRPEGRLFVMLHSAAPRDPIKLTPADACRHYDSDVKVYKIAAGVMTLVRVERATYYDNGGVLSRMLTGRHRKKASTCVSS